MTGIWEKDGCREVSIGSWRDEDRGGRGGERGEIAGLSVTLCGRLSALLFSSSFYPVPVTFTERPQQRWWMESETGERTKIRVRETDEKWQWLKGVKQQEKEREKSRIKLNRVHFCPNKIYIIIKIWIYIIYTTTFIITFMCIHHIYKYISLPIYLY